MTASTATSVTTQVYRVYIRATPQAIWDAITDPAWSEKYGYGGRVGFDRDFRPGSHYEHETSDAMRAMGAPGRRHRRRDRRGRPAAQARRDVAHGHG